MNLNDDVAIIFLIKLFLIINFGMPKGWQGYMCWRNSSSQNLVPPPQDRPGSTRIYFLILTKGVWLHSRLHDGGVCRRYRAYSVNYWSSDKVIQATPYPTLSVISNTITGQAAYNKMYLYSRYVKTRIRTTTISFVHF